MPFFKLIEYIKYKAEWEGVKVTLVKESYTSKVSHRCGKEGKRITQGLFKCPHCGLEYNADLNGAINIAKSSPGYMLRDEAPLTEPLTPSEVGPPKPCRLSGELTEIGRISRL